MIVYIKVVRDHYGTGQDYSWIWAECKGLDLERVKESNPDCVVLFLNNKNCKTIRK